MKKNYLTYCFILCFLVISTLSCSSDSVKKKDVAKIASKEVTFVNLTIDEAVAKAQKEGKLVFIDFYTVTCGGCIKLNEEVLHDAEMAEFLNSRAISVKINGVKGKGIEVSKKYKVFGYPTVMILEANGIERDRISGYDNKEIMVKKITDYINGKNILSGFLKELEENPSDVDVNLKIARRYVDRYQRRNSLKYFRKVLELDPEDVKGHKTEANHKNILYSAIYEKKVEDLEKYLENATNSANIKEGYEILIKIYKRQRNVAKVIEAYEKQISKFPEDYYVKNEYAWDVYQNRVAAKYSVAIIEAEKAVADAPGEANRLDTLAWLYFENGDQEKAVNAITKAVEKSSPDKKEAFRKNLEMIKKGKKTEK